MKYIYRILFALTVSTFALPALASVTATLDKSNVASGETVQLQLQHDGTTDSPPDLAPLRNDFDVLGSSSGSNVQIINGHVSSQTQVTVLLSPKHDGTIQIPPLQWDGQQTAALELTVGGSGNAAAAGQPGPTSGESSHIFLTATLDQKQPYVQAADVLTVRLYADQPIFQASLDLPASSDVLVKQLGKDKQSSETRNGRNYQIVERKYLLCPAAQRHAHPGRAGARRPGAGHRQQQPFRQRPGVRQHLRANAARGHAECDASDTPAWQTDHAERAEAPRQCDRRELAARAECDAAGNLAP